MYIKKKCIIFSLLGISILFNVIAFAQKTSLEESLAKEGLSGKEYDEILTYYYKNPQPDKLILVLKVTLSQNEVISDKIHFNPFTHFIATVAHNNQPFFDKVKELKENYSGIQKDALEYIISESENFESPSPDTPFLLDYLWAEFIATGEERPVRKIISVLDYQWPRETKAKEVLTDADVERALLVGAAQWSLRSNAEQHEKVYEIIKDELTSATGPRKEKLEKILQEIKR